MANQSNGRAENGGEQPDAIERLERELYAPGRPSILREEKKRRSDRRPVEAPEQWLARPPANRPKRPSPPGSLLRRLFLISLIFFSLAAAVAALIIFGGFNLISARNVDLMISGLTVIESGEELVLEVSLANRNRVYLDDILLSVDYPEGSHQPEDLSQRLNRLERKLSPLPPGGEQRETFRAVLFGEQNSLKKIVVSVEYRHRGQNAVLSKSQTYEVGIRSVPVVVSALYPKELSSGQTVEFKINVASNSNSPLKDLLFRIDYPVSGFVFQEAQPAPSYGQNLWRLGDLEARDERQIMVKGILTGLENEERVFRLVVGAADPNNQQQIGLELTSGFESVFLKKPLVGLEAAINGSREEVYVSRLQSPVKVKIDWLNNLPADLNQLSVEAKLLGPAIDKFSVAAAQGGFYRSDEDRLIWDENTTPVFSRIRPGESGALNFSFNTLKAAPEIFQRLRHQPLELKIKAQGWRFSENRPPELVESEISRIIKLETQLSLSARAVFSVGPFVNRGPLPPKAEQTTTYTVIWALSNTLNDVSDIAVSAVLPVYAEWLNQVSPSTAAVSFNPIGRMVTWRLENLPAGIGFSSSPQEASFQISIKPSLNQVGQTLDLIGEANLIGSDNFTSIDVVDRWPALNTRIVTDPAFQNEFDRVVS